jgi:hypothetical protein
MLSYDDFVPATESAAEKAFWIHRDWYAMMAGDTGLAFPVIRRVQKCLPEKSIKITLDDMTGWFRTAYQAQLQQEVEDRFLGVYGMTLAAFKRDGYQMLGSQEFPNLNDAIRLLQP